MGLRFFSRDKRKGSAIATAPLPAGVDAATPARPDFQPSEPERLDDDSLRRLFQQGRYNVILRERVRWRTHALGTVIVGEAAERIEESMALVPAGCVSLCRTLAAQPGDPEDDHEIEPYLLAIHAVTQREYQRFVDDGGYDTLELWPEDIWPHIIEMKDQTGQTGPRFWREGRHDRRLSDHPIVGLCFYEAQAYSRWVGLRLPTEAEWQMAASWHIKSEADVYRRFPWGDAMETSKCNIWLSGIGTTVPVDAYPNGAAPNQVRQLTGNVWEWVDSSLGLTDEYEGPIFGEMPLYAIRGGAFDTYFESQATSQFRTGQIALARCHNVGFRLAMDLVEAPWIH